MSSTSTRSRATTGNEGASVERTDRRAALVVRPRAAFLSMTAAAGLQVSLPYLADVANAMQGAGSKAPQARDADSLARAMIASWPGNRRFLRQDQTTAAKSVHHRPASGVASRFTVRPQVRPSHQGRCSLEKSGLLSGPWFAVAGVTIIRAAKARGRRPRSYCRRKAILDFANPTDSLKDFVLPLHVLTIGRKKIAIQPAKVLFRLRTKPG